MRWQEEDLQLQENGGYKLPCCGIEFNTNIKFPVVCGCRELKVDREIPQENELERLEKAISELEKHGINPDNVHELAEKESAGLGDTIEKALKKVGITEDLVKKLTGLKECGCTKRKKFLNKVFPYRKTK